MVSKRNGHQKSPETICGSFEARLDITIRRLGSS